MLSSIELYPFQHEASQALEYVFSEADLSARALLTMAPRTGKTEVVIENYRNFREGQEDPKGLYLCDTTLIPRQAQDRFVERIGDDLSTTNNPLEEDKEFTFSTFQAMRDHIADRLIKPGKYDYIVVDECHHTPADTYAAVVKYLQPKRLVGLSGTPNRLDGKDVTELFGESVYGFGLGEMIARGFSKSVDYHVKLDEELREDLIKAEIIDGPLLNESARAIHPNLKLIAKDIRSELEALEDPKAIVFAQNIDHAHLVSTFLGKSNEVVHSEQSLTENQDAIKRFNDGDISTIIAIDMLNEGIDLPDANVVAFLRSTASERIFLQQLARGLQKSDIHDELLVLDYVANEERLELIAKLLQDISTHEIKSTEPAVVKNDDDTQQEPWLDRPKGNANFSIDDRVKSLFESVNERVVVKERQNHINQLHHDRPELMKKMGIIRAVRTFGPSVRTPRSQLGQAYPNMLAHISFNQAEQGRLKKAMRDQWSLGWGANPKFTLDKTSTPQEQIEEIFPRYSEIIIQGSPILEFHHELFRIEKASFVGDKHVVVEPHEALSAIAQDIVLRLSEDDITVDQEKILQFSTSITSNNGDIITIIVKPMTDGITLRIRAKGDQSKDAKTYHYHAKPRSAKVAARALESRKVIEKDGKFVGYDFNEEEILQNIKKLSELRDELANSGKLVPSATGLSVRSTELVDQIARLAKSVDYDRKKFRLAQAILNEQSNDLRFYFKENFPGMRNFQRANDVNVEKVNESAWKVSSPKATITIQGFDPYRQKIPEISAKNHADEPITYNEIEKLLKEIHPRFLYSALRTANATEVVWQ